MKWAGGKKQLLPEIVKRLPESILDSGEIEYYFEPFVGAGAVFFYLMCNFNIKNAYISDINKELILVYNVIQKDPEKLISILHELEDEFLKLDTPNRKKYYLNLRSEFNKQLETFDFNNYNDENILRASKTIFMNKTGFNGLFRLNRKGEFNVPFGKYKNPTICDEENIINDHNILKNVNIKNASYLDCEELINNESLVYLDPPYRPLNKSSSFTNYTGNEFKDKEQIELSEFYKRINKKDAKIILSNSDPKNTDSEDNFFDDLYSDFNIERVNAKRSINSNAKKRGTITELLIKNY
ncbi:DNA adenine methylase [Methanobrevibacter acididurans]|uniref:DNA adenine methylase n=1 Tax=Methanobrevibacter acididurans TaxID=120963 RepID=UPI0038FD06E8